MPWKINGEGPEVLEVWEDFNGNLWFVSEHIDDDIKYGYARFYHMPDCAEWGTFSINEIKNAHHSPHMVWRVTKRNWPNIESYEKGLFVEVE